MRRNALSTLAQSDPEQRQAKLDDPNVHERVKQSIREQMQREAEALAYVPRTRTRRGPTPESLVLKAVLQALKHHPKVAMCWRQNSGAMMASSGSGYDYLVSFGPRGISDVIGYLRDGRFLAVECKGPDGHVKQWQQDFIDNVNSYGGVAFVARSADDIAERLR